MIIGRKYMKNAGFSCEMSRLHTMYSQSVNWRRHDVDGNPYHDRCCFTICG